MFHKKRWYKYQVLGIDKSYFVEKKRKKKDHSNSAKGSLKLIPSKYWSFWLTTYLLCVMGVFFNRQSAFLWVPTVLHFSPMYSFIRTGLTSYSDTIEAQSMIYNTLHIKLKIEQLKTRCELGCLGRINISAPQVVSVVLLCWLSYPTTSGSLDITDSQ